MLEKFSYIKLSFVDSNIEEKMKELFIKNEQQKRYEHVCSVVKQIDIIASQYGLVKEKCCIAALLHDISTLINPEDMLSYAEISHPFLLHQRISEVVAREDFGITDSEILEAIGFHTSLCENASQYQMALFVADKLAWSYGGYPPYYEQMSKALNILLEAACYEYIKYMENEGRMYSVHVDWAKAVRWIKVLFNIGRSNQCISAD